MVEFYYMCQSDNGSFDDQSALRQWSVNYMRSLDTLKDPRAPMQLQNMFAAAGMRNAECRMIPVPLCGWSNSKCPRCPRCPRCPHNPLVEAAALPFGLSCFA